MALKQIQHLRGTADENDVYVGLDGEFTVDKTNKALRIHDGNTPGGSTIVSEESTRVPTVSDLKNLRPTDNRVVVVEGYNSSGDDGGGVFYWLPGVTNSDGGVQIESNVSGFQVGDSDQGVWARLIDRDSFNVDWWGATTGLGTDSTSEIQNSFNFLPDRSELKINSIYSVVGDLTFNSSFVNISGSGAIFCQNNGQNYDQVVDLQGENNLWNVNIVQTTADSSHNGAGRAITVNGAGNEFNQVRIFGESSTTPRPNVYISNGDRTQFIDCDFNGASSAVIEYGGTGSVDVFDSTQNSVDNNVPFIDLVSPIEPGDIAVNGLEVITGSDLIAGSENDSVQIQRNYEDPRNFTSNQNPQQLGLNKQYNRGDKVFRRTVNPTEGIGWICISDGSPGVWNEFGKVETEKSGFETFDGDGSKTKFDIEHNLGGTPSVWNVTPTLKDGSVFSHVKARPTTLRVIYDYAPPSGTANVGLNWRVDRNEVYASSPDKTYLTDADGQTDFDGNGSKQRFIIPHGFGGTPRTWSVTPSSSDASDIARVNINDTSLIVRYDSAPPNGSNNVSINWSVDPGFYNENENVEGGRIIRSGDGNQTSFNVSHGLGVIPNYWTVEARSEDGRNISYVTADSSSLTVNYSSTPVSGTDNVRFTYFVSSKDYTNFSTENAGEAVFSGDGSTTTFNISHGLGTTPSNWLLDPSSSDGSDLDYVDADNNNLIVNLNSAPPSGTDNVKFTWIAKE